MFGKKKKNDRPASAPFSFADLFGNAGREKAILAKDQIAELLNTTPEVLEAFEASYQWDILDAGVDTNSLFDFSAKQAAGIIPEAEVTEAASQLYDHIVRELIAQTPVMDYDGKELHILEPKDTLGDGAQPVTAAEIMAFPEPLRPQLSGNLMKLDIGEPTSHALLYYYKRWQEAKNPKEKEWFYFHFRQGLDILDLDGLTYEMLGLNRNSIGHWLPALCAAVGKQSFFKVPKTRVIKVPITMLQLSRLDYGLLTPGTMEVVDRFCYQVFGLEEDKDYFIKTGVWSSKFDFRNAKVTGAKEVRELGQYLVFIQNQGQMLASPLHTPSVFGACTTNEWAVREFIHDVEGNPCIYKGLPLHTEYRVFIDCETGKVIGINPYWDPKEMKKRFGHEKDANSPHQVHDYIIYKAHEEKLMGRYEANKDAVVNNIEAMIPDMAAAGLTGQWSVDVMQNGEDFYIIDMALAANSAFKECIPKGVLKIEEENWLPKLPEPKGE